MKCRQFERRINDLLDHRQSLRSDRHIADHAAQCESCEETLHHYQRLEAFFAGNAGPAAKQPQLTKHRAIRRASTEVVVWSDRRRWRAALAIAASLLCLTIPLLTIGGNRLPQVAQRDVGDQRQANPNVDVADVPAPIALEDLLATIEQLPEQLEQLGPVYQYTAHMTGVAPLTSSLNVTVDLLRQQIGNSPVPKKRLPRSQGTWLTGPFLERAV